MVSFTVILKDINMSEKLICFRSCKLIEWLSDTALSKVGAKHRIAVSVCLFLSVLISRAHVLLSGNRVCRFVCERENFAIHTLIFGTKHNVITERHLKTTRLAVYRGTFAKLG